MATIFDWCCRRLGRGRSCSPSEDGSEEEGKESRAKGKGGRSSRFAKSASSDGASKKKKKSEKQRGKAEANQGSGGLADLSLVKREHEVLRSYKKPPPPRNRARASRVPRGLKAQNSNANHVELQEVDETKLPEEDAPSTSVVADEDSSSPTHLPNADEGSKPSSTASSSDTSDKRPAEADEESSPAAAVDSQDNLKEIKDVSKEDNADETEKLDEAGTVVLEPARAEPSTEDTNSSSETPVQTEDVTPDGRTNDGGHVDASLKPETKSENEDSEKEQTQDDVSSDRSDGGDDADDDGGDGGGGERDDSGDGEGSGVSPNKGTPEDLEQPEADGAPTEPNASCAAAEEDDVQKVSMRSASSSKYPSSATQKTHGKGKRFPVPSVHGESMDQLMKSLQIHLKEEGISLDDDAPDKNPKAAKQEPSERARPLSDIVQPKDRQVDIADGETVWSASGDQPEDGKMDIAD